jgi:hypothetical protein
MQQVDKSESQLCEGPQKKGKCLGSVAKIRRGLGFFKTGKFGLKISGDFKLN